MGISTKEFTDKQSSFLEAFLGEARGNIRLAMDLAGYSKSTKVTEVVGPLKEITERTGLMLAMNAPKAAFGIVCVLHDPAAMGARNAMDLDEDKILNDPRGIFTDYFLYLNTVGKLASGISKNEINIEAEKQASILKAKDLIIIGTEKEVLDRLINFIDIVGPFGTLLLTGHDHYGWKELWSNTLLQMSENIKLNIFRHLQ